MVHTVFQSDDLLLILVNESLLRPDVLVWLVLNEKFFNDVEKLKGVELKEKFHKPVVGQKPHDIVDVAAPLERAE